MSKYVNPFTDIGFKRIFGQEFSKPMLLDFLNCLLRGERCITELTLHDKERPGHYDGDRSIIYDIFCETDTGEKIIVEMQNREQPNFKERTLYYASESVVRQGERGTDWGYEVKAVYLVAFVNFRMEGLGRQFRTDVGLTDLRSGELFSDKLRFVYLQLPCFTKEPDECENDFERWIYVLKNMETLNRLPWAAQNSVFQRLAEIAEVSAMTKEERQEYDGALKRYRDTLNVMRGAEQKGRAEGRAEVVKAMRSKGYSDEDIMMITGISHEELESI
ncbi:MAG: PD-(D/E)XK nuclease family transposase [Prevotella sp.]|nr:PD-(D/E)XK nuclease family transposase [Prevotella sp.]